MRKAPKNQGMKKEISFSLSLVFIFPDPNAKTDSRRKKDGPEREEQETFFLHTPPSSSSLFSPWLCNINQDTKAYK